MSAEKLNLVRTHGTNNDTRQYQKDTRGNTNDTCGNNEDITAKIITNMVILTKSYKRTHIQHTRFPLHTRTYTTVYTHHHVSRTFKSKSHFFVTHLCTIFHEHSIHAYAHFKHDIRTCTTFRAIDIRTCTTFNVHAVRTRTCTSYIRSFRLQKTRCELPLHTQQYGTHTRRFYTQSSLPLADDATREAIMSGVDAFHGDTHGIITCMALSHTAFSHIRDYCTGTALLHTHTTRHHVGGRCLPR